MNKKKLLSLVLALTLVGVVGIGATLAYFTDKSDVTNTFTMGHVDITLTEKEVVFDEATGEYVESEDAIDEDGLEFADVMPGQTVPKTPVIAVEDGSEDAYIRAKIEIGGLTDEQAAQLLAGIAINEGWTLTDGYYYYNVAVTENTKVELFNTVTIPGAWGNEMADAEFNVQVYAEAIQAVYVDDVLVKDGDNVIGWNLGDATIEEYQPSVSGNN